MMKINVVIVSICLFILSGCSQAQKLEDQRKMGTEIAEGIFETLTAEAPSSTPFPSSTNTLQPTQTPTNTLTSTSTKVPTATMSPSPTLQNVLGETVKCGTSWEIIVHSPPQFEDIVYHTPPKGAYAVVYFSLKNIQNQTDSVDFASEAFQLIGEIDGQALVFDVTTIGTSAADREKGYVNWNSDVPPLVQIETMGTFDVNPNAENWKLRMKVEHYSWETGENCNLEINLME
jgi:hypothetical protein